MRELPYGSWPSPVSAELLTAASVGLGSPRFDGSDVYWLEARADQGGRVALWQRGPSGALIELTAKPFNVRTRVHEYGGGEYAVAAEIVVFSHFGNGRVHRLGPSSPPEPITPEADVRYGDLRVHPGAGLVLAVREDHRGGGEPVSTVVALDLDGDNLDCGRVVCSGADFYADPELAPDGRLAWTEWNHPSMPWDATAIKVGRLTTTGLEDVADVAGGPSESAVHPRWTPDGRLIFVSDRTGWWNLYAWAGGEARPLHPDEAEYAVPPWQLGRSPYAVLDDTRLLVTRVAEGRSTLELLDLDAGTRDRLSPDGCSVAGVVVGDGAAAAVLQPTDGPARLAALDLTDRSWNTVRRASDLELPAGTVSVPEAVHWSGPAGPVHGWYYPPTHPDTRPPAGSRPPMITFSHGGPTGMVPPAFSLGYQFWTSRGVAVLDVNYSGSTGFGRAYRERLHGQWGVLDVADCVAGARAMGDQGRADPDRLVIMGGSAGGYTTLQALVTSDAFAAGVSSYGVGDLAALARDTHKFESRYLDGLVGRYPDAAELYQDRSPLFHVDRLSSPLLLLQGSEDAVVPPNQAETMAAAVRAKGLPVALIIFAGEGHGFRRAESIQAAARAELYFLGRVLGFTPADDLPPIEIDNL